MVLADFLKPVIKSCEGVVFVGQSCNFLLPCPIFILIYLRLQHVYTVCMHAVDSEDLTAARWWLKVAR